MDANQFDRFTQSLAAGGSRRSFLRGGFAAVLASIGLRRIVQGVACTPPGNIPATSACNSDAECCFDGVCVNGLCRCPTGMKLCAGICVPISHNCSNCPVGWQRCNGACMNVQSDRFNCGSCGHQCPANSTCSHGHCCPKGKIWCNGACIMMTQCT